MQKVEITSWTIIKIILIGLAFWALFHLLNILALLFVTLILVAAVAPIAQMLVQRGIPRTVAATLILLGIIAILAGLLALIVPALATELQTFISQQLPSLVERLTPHFAITQGQEMLSTLVKELQSLSGNIINGVVSLFGGLVSALTILALTFYLLVEEHPLRHAGIKFWPENQRRQIVSSLGRMSEKLGSWLRGQFLLSLIVGTLTAAFLGIIGVAAPIAIGVLAGVLEIVPILGAFITGVVMVSVAAMSADAALLKVTLALLFFVAIQVLESQVLVPNIMKKAIGISPVIIIVTLLVGEQLGGIVGAILSIPIAAIIQVLAEDWPKLRKAFGY